MLFKDGDLAAELVLAPKELREVAHDLDDAMEAAGLGPAIITDVGRTLDFYDDGTEWSWHLVYSALDIRTRHLSLAKKLFVRDWLIRRCADDSRFNVVLEMKAKRGEHLHIEFEDAARKAAWLAQRKAGAA